MTEHTTHTEYNRTVKDARYAVMMIHGILATPNFWNDFIKLVPENISVYTLLLDGHGGAVEDFAATSMEKWKAQVEGVFDGLCARYEKLYLVGHSMGTLFSIQLAAMHPEKVEKLFLLASPMKVAVKLVAAKYSLKVVFDKIDDSVPIERAAKETISITPDKRLWKYIPWAPRFLELFSEIRRTRIVLPSLTVPAFVYQSAQDELVSIKSVEYFEHHPRVHLTVLEHSSHQCYSDEDRALLLDGFKSMFA